MAQLFANNASSALASVINDTDNTIVLATGEGARFPSPSGGDYFLLTLTQATGLESSWEIVKCTARTADTLTVTRAQESTSAAVWASGTKAELRITAQTLSVAAAPRWIPKTSADSPFQMVSGESYKIDTSGGAVTGVLPATMAANDRICVMDLKGTFATNNFTVSRNGHNVDGVADDEGIICDIDNAQIEITYHDVTTGVTAR